MALGGVDLELGFQLALATGHPSTFAGSVAAIEEQLTALGLWDDGAVLFDGTTAAEVLGKQVTKEPRFQLPHAAGWNTSFHPARSVRHAAIISSPG